jgi:hypothetical protein
VAGKGGCGVELNVSLEHINHQVKQGSGRMSSEHKIGFAGLPLCYKLQQGPIQERGIM